MCDLNFGQLLLLSIDYSFIDCIQYTLSVDLMMNWLLLNLNR